MAIQAIIRVAATAVGEHRVRSALGAAGIALAVAVTLTSLGVSEGARRAAQAEVDRLGIDTVIVTGRAGSLSIKDADAIRHRVPGIEDVSAMLSVRTPASGALGARTIAVSGVTETYASIRRIEIPAGRFISAADEFSAAKVCVIGERLAFALLGPSPVGAPIRVGSNWFRVIGVMPAGSPDEENLFVPLSALLPQRASMNPSQSVTSVWIRVPMELIRSSEPAIREILAADHRSGTYDVVIARSLLNARSRTQVIFLRVSLATGGLLFLLGGAAIANALLSSVLERVSEIGVRRAVGARRRHIAVQFLFEATLIAMAGAAVGVAGGLLLIAAAVHRGWDVAVPVAAVLAIPAMATLTALIAGTYPAMRAAAVEPIDALSRG